MPIPMVCLVPSFNETSTVPWYATASSPTRTSATGAIDVSTATNCLRTFAFLASCFSNTELKSFSRQRGRRSSPNFAIAASAFAVDGYTLTELVTSDCPSSKLGDFARGFFRFVLLNATNGLQESIFAPAATCAASDVCARALDVHVAGKSDCTSTPACAMVSADEDAAYAGVARPASATTSTTTANV